MLISRHITASVIAGAGIWFFSKSFFAALVCFASGVLADSDHVIEYIIHHGWREFSIKKLYQACEETASREGEYRFKRLYLIFHMVEGAFFLWAVSLYTKNIFLLATALGYSIHLLMDCMGNPIYPYAYFILWRALNRFETDRIFRKMPNKRSYRRDGYEN